ncbi:MAG: single-stranded DNA-binding protein [Solobacterium sp.]|nr:single-stranded DNA-binding protein [Solobacterium sp.]
MLSTCVIVGHVADDVEIVKTSNGNSLCYLTVETSRPFRNDD